MPTCLQSYRTFTYDEFRDLSEQYNTFTTHLSQLLATTYQSAQASADSSSKMTQSMQQTAQLSHQQIEFSQTITDSSNQITRALKIYQQILTACIMLTVST